MKRKIAGLLAVTMVATSIVAPPFTTTVLAENSSAGVEQTAEETNLLAKIDNQEVTPEYLGIPGEARYGTQYYARNIWDMAVKDGKVLLSMGDYDTNTGAVPIYYYTNDSKEKKECSYTSPVTTKGLSSEEIKRFFRIDGEIYAVATDPLGMAHGSYYKYDSTTNRWTDFYKLPLCIHCYDMVEYKGEVFFAGMVRDNNQQIVSCMQKLSKDDLGSNKNATKVDFYDLKGKKMEIYKMNYTDQYGNPGQMDTTDLWRSYDMFVYKDELYAAHSSGSIYSMNDTSGLFKYDKKNNRFVQISKGDDIKGFMSVTRNINYSASYRYNDGRVETKYYHYNFEDNKRIEKALTVGKEIISGETICGAKISTPNMFVAVCNGIFKSKDVKTFEKVSLGKGYENYVTRDAFALGGKYYFLASQMNGTDDYTTAVFETDGNFAKFRKVLSFPTKSFARSFAYNDGMLYVGLGGNGRSTNASKSTLSKYSGTLYRVHLDNLNYKEEIKPVVYKKVSEVNFADSKSWRSGNYSYNNGEYSTHNNRVCLTDYVTVEQGKTYTVNVANNYHMLIRELDKDGKFLKSHNLANQATYTPVKDCYKIGISIYNPAKEDVTYDSFKTLLQGGKVFSLTEKKAVVVEPTTEKKEETKPAEPTTEKKQETKPAEPTTEKKEETKPAEPTTEKKQETKPAEPTTEKKQETKPAEPTTEKKEETKPAEPTTPSVPAPSVPVLDEPERPVPPKNTTVETREDGTKVETTTETTIDGIKVETVTETTTNGVVTQKETKVQTDGSSVVTTKTQGITVVVNKNTSGNIASAKAYCTITGSKTAVSAKASISKEVLQQVTSLSGTNQVKVTIKIQIPVVVKQKDLFTANQTQTAYTVTLNANDVKENNPLYIYAYDSNKKQYTMVNATTYKVQEDGSLSINVPAGKAYVLLNKTDMTKVSNKILSTVKLAATTKTMKPGKKTKVTLSKSLDMANVKKVTYLVSNKKVATVSSKGVVTCKKKGTVTVKVKVTLKNGKTKTLSMKVKINKK